MTTTVRVNTSVRERLKRVRLGKSHSRTVAYLAGRWQRRQTPLSAAEYGRLKDTTVTVSDDCHGVLKRLKSDLGVSTLGDVIAVLVDSPSATG